MSTLIFKYREHKNFFKKLLYCLLSITVFNTIKTKDSDTSQILAIKPFPSYVLGVKDVASLKITDSIFSNYNSLYIHNANSTQSNDTKFLDFVRIINVTNQIDNIMDEFLMIENMTNVKTRFDFSSNICASRGNTSKTPTNQICQPIKLTILPMSDIGRVIVATGMNEQEYLYGNWTVDLPYNNLSIQGSAKYLSIESNKTGNFYELDTEERISFQFDHEVSNITYFDYLSENEDYLLTFDDTNTLTVWNAQKEVLKIYAKILTVLDQKKIEGNQGTLHEVWDLDYNTKYFAMWFSSMGDDGITLYQVIRINWDTLKIYDEDPIKIDGTLKKDNCKYLYNLVGRNDKSSKSWKYDILVCVGDSEIDGSSKGLFLYQINKLTWKITATRLYKTEEQNSICPQKLSVNNFEGDFFVTSFCQDQQKTTQDIYHMYIIFDSLEIVWDKVNEEEKITFEMTHTDYYFHSIFNKNLFTVVDYKNKEAFSFSNSLEKLAIYFHVDDNETFDYIMYDVLGNKSGYLMINLVKTNKDTQKKFQSIQLFDLNFLTHSNMRINRSYKFEIDSEVSSTAYLSAFCRNTETLKQYFSILDVKNGLLSVTYKIDVEGFNSKAYINNIDPDLPIGSKMKVETYLPCSGDDIFDFSVKTVKGTIGKVSNVHKDNKVDIFDNSIEIYYKF